MSLQKTWGNIHLTALGAMMLSFLLVGCDGQRRAECCASRPDGQRR